MPTPVLDTSHVFRRKEKVVAASELPGVPAGTAGKVLLINGFQWIRYRVLFENGNDLGSIDRGLLASKQEWAEIERLRRKGETVYLTEADLPDDAATAAVADDGDAAAAPAGGVVVNGVEIPQRLLDMSVARRKILAGG